MNERVMWTAEDIVNDEGMLAAVLDALANKCQAASVRKGFSDPDGRNTDINQKLLLCVGELCEAQEELRSGHHVQEVYFNQDSNPPGKPEGFGIELADALIREFQLSGALGLPIGRMIVEKMRYNDKRPFKHGKQF